jgi:tetratricopeptide (TPR) repeat protein
MEDLALSKPKPTLKENAIRLLRKLHTFKPEPTRNEKISRLFDSVMEKTKESDFEGAIDKLHSILEIENNIEAHCIKGIIYLELGIVPMAEVEFRNIVLTSSESKQREYFDHYNVTRYFLARNDIPIYNFKNIAYSEVHQAMIYISIGYPEKAEEYFKMAVSYAKEAKNPAV